MNYKENLLKCRFLSSWSRMWCYYAAPGIALKNQDPEVWLSFHYGQTVDKQNQV